MELHTNEIRDYLARAPKRWQFNGMGMVNNTGARLRWLETICRGTLHERINRRAGIVQEYAPWRHLNPAQRSVRRHWRKEQKRKYGYVLNP